MSEVSSSADRRKTSHRILDGWYLKTRSRALPYNLGARTSPFGQR